MAQEFLRSDGTLYEEGETIQRPTLGNTLEQISMNGPNVMYGTDGVIGRMFVEDVQQAGGILTVEDMHNYRVQWETNNYIVTNLTSELKLYTTSLPSSGPVLAFMLNLMHKFVPDMVHSKQPILWQRLVETFKHGFGVRSHLGDPQNDRDPYATSIREYLQKLCTTKFAETTAALINSQSTHSHANYYGANYNLPADRGTANMCVLAANGDAVVLTSTVNSYFGAKLISPRTGILLNNEMDDFSVPEMSDKFGLPASPANYIQPGKMPMSSMCPCIILDREGRVRLLIGSAGGSKILTTMATIIIKYIILGESLDCAINAARLHHQLIPMFVEYELGFPNDVLNYLSSIGHEIREASIGSFAAATGIGMRHNRPEPIFDKRRGGSTAIVALER